MRKLLPGIALTLCSFAGSAAMATEKPVAVKAVAVAPASVVTKADAKTATNASLLAQTDKQFSVKDLLERKPETNKERMDIARVIVTRHLAPTAPLPLKGKEQQFAKKHVIKLMDDAQNKEDPRAALSMAMQLYTSDELGFKDDKKAVKLLENAVKKGMPFAGADLAIAYAQGALGLKANTAKALELLNMDTGPRNPHVLAFKASLLADQASAATYDLDGAIAAARLAYNLNPKDEMVVSLLSGLLISNRANEAHVKEGHEILTQWTHKLRQLEMEDGSKLANAAVEAAKKREAATIIELPAGTKIEGRMAPEVVKATEAVAK